MVNPLTFYNALTESGVDFYAGVPDSLLGSFCSCVAEHSAEDRHIITANEGAAIALAAGDYLASAKPSLVYMQNSGLGNAINPLLSLADASVYGIPMLLMIGWRGEPGLADEPQHLAQGKATVALLDAMGITHCHLPKETSEAIVMLKQLHERTLEENKPIAMLVSKDTFSEYKTDDNKPDEAILLTRERAIELILKAIKPDSSVVASTGMISRELYELRDGLKQSHDTDFLTVGSMGHCSQVALGVALAGESKQVICLDGDGAALMHMGSLAIIGQAATANLVHVILNNGRHDSVGGQPTCGLEIDFATIAKGCGYRSADIVSSESELLTALETLSNAEGPVLLDLRIGPGHRADLGRPNISPQDQKHAFMRHLEG